MSGENLEQLRYLHPKLRAYVNVLLSHEFGLLKDSPKIQCIQSGSIVRKNENLYGDRFQLRILYCQKPLVWHVLMNGNDIKKAPDFIMEENFLSDLTPETIVTKVPSLVNWCPTNVKCLLNVVLELLDLYKCYQINLLQVHPSLQRYLFEYETLLSMSGMNENNIEVCVQARNYGVVFLIHVNVDFSKLPTALPNCKSLVVLIVEFKLNAKHTLQLIPRLELEDLFGESIELPDFRTSNMSLLDYVPSLEDMLQNKVEKIIHFTHQRKMLYSYLVQLFEPSLINGDNINFKNVSFLLCLEEFYCVLNVQIPINYPEVGPTLRLMAFKKPLGAKEVIEKTFNDFVFHENMSPEEVAMRIFQYVKHSAISEFTKTICDRRH